MAGLMQRVAPPLCAIGLSGAVGAYVLPHTFMLSYLRELHQAYHLGEPVPLDKHTKQLTSQVCQDMLLPEPGVEFFSCSGFDLVHKGSFKLRNGPVVGLPIYFKYKSVDDINTNKIFVVGKGQSWDNLNREKHKPPNWETKAGKELIDSLVLSVEARKFAIARELSMAGTHYNYIHSGIALSYGVLAYWVGFGFNTMLGLKSRLKPWARGGVYGIISGITLYAYLFSKDAYNYQREIKADKVAGSVSVQYAIGGVEFYEKALQRNLAIREMMGEEGAKLFSAKGNRNLLLRSPGVPLTKRRDTLLDKCMEQSQDIAQHKVESTI